MIWIHRRHSRLRPAERDDVRTCGHANANHFFFDATSPVSRLRWIALCRECFIQFGHTPEVAIRVETEAA